MRRREFATARRPSILVMAGLLLLPLYRTLGGAFRTSTTGRRGRSSDWTNYRQAFSDPRFGDAVVFTVGLTLLVTAFCMVAGYILAVLVNGLGRSKPYVLGHPARAPT